METKSKTVIRMSVYIVLLIISSLPLFCGYIMEGGEVQLWMARIEEVAEGLKNGQFHMIPSAEVIISHGGQITALNTNLWLLIPALLRVLGVSVAGAYIIYLFLLNIFALLSARKMFQALFDKEIYIFFGVMLYMTSAYRLYLFYDKASLGMAAAWAVIPWVFGSFTQWIEDAGSWKKGLWAVLGLTLVGYADGILMLTVIGIMILQIIIYRKWSGVLMIAMAGVAFMPGAIYWLRYILKGGMEVWNLPLTSISSNGYVVGEFLHSWVYRTDHPGLGLGILMALVVWGWQMITEQRPKSRVQYKVLLPIVVLMTLMSTRYFPWDVVQRLGSPFLRLVGMVGTPAIFIGFVSLGACVIGVCGIEMVSKQEKLFVKIGFPIMIFFSAVGVAVYICNTLTYNRLPLEWM